MKQVVIVGGGFAGLNCARKLASRPDIHITLIDKNNYQQFQPLLYQIATAQLSVTNAAFGLRSVLRDHPNVDVKLGEAVSADLKARTATIATGEKYQGDFLVLASGSQANFFGTPGASHHAYPLYSIHDAEVLRSRILAVFESVNRDRSLIAKGALNFVIVGAGPTGAEMAGALGDWAGAGMKKTYGDALGQAQIFLVDRGHAVLSAFSEKAQTYAAKMLQQRKVSLRLGTSVEEVGDGHVVLSDGTKILTHTVVWAGGLKASALSSGMGIQTGRGGRLDVEPDLTVKGFQGVYALGDFANITGKDGTPLPQLASVAEQSGKWCAKNIESDLAGEARRPFDYFDKGIMAMIGREAAVAEVGKHRHELQGAIAFSAWLGVHAALLTNTRAKVGAFIEWAWDYFGHLHSDPILDRPDQANINWNEDEPTEMVESSKAPSV
jgi:NADH dehydrogenase